MTTPATIARATAFGACIIVTAALTQQAGGVFDTMDHVPLRPPPWVFRVVWPALYVTTGWAWAWAGASVDVPMAMTTLLCCAWLVLYTLLRWRRLAALTLASVCALVTLVAARESAPARSALLAPLAVWTAFATYLNVYAAAARPAPPSS